MTVHHPSRMVTTILNAFLWKRHDRKVVSNKFADTRNIADKRYRSKGPLPIELLFQDQDQTIGETLDEYYKTNKVEMPQRKAALQTIFTRPSDYEKMPTEMAKVLLTNPNRKGQTSAAIFIGGTKQTLNDYMSTKNIGVDSSQRNESASCYTSEGRDP